MMGQHKLDLEFSDSDEEMQGNNGTFETNKADINGSQRSQTSMKLPATSRSSSSSSEEGGKLSERFKKI